MFAAHTSVFVLPPAALILRYPGRYTAGQDKHDRYKHDAPRHSINNPFPRAAGTRAARFHQLLDATDTQVYQPSYACLQSFLSSTLPHHHRPSLVDARALKQLSTSTHTELQSIQRAAREVANATTLQDPKDAHPALLTSVSARIATALGHHHTHLHQLQQQVTRLGGCTISPIRVVMVST